MKTLSGCDSIGFVLAGVEPALHVVELRRGRAIARRTVRGWNIRRRLALARLECRQQGTQRAGLQAVP